MKQTWKRRINAFPKSQNREASQVDLPEKSTHQHRRSNANWSPTWVHKIF